MAFGLFRKTLHHYLWSYTVTGGILTHRFLSPGQDNRALRTMSMIDEFSFVISSEKNYQKEEIL